LYLAGELENRESLAKPKLETALSALRDHGLVKLTMKGNLEPSPDASHQLEGFVEQLRRYLR
jgi:DNA-binding transcriptional ArsR family regulator